MTITEKNELRNLFNSFKDSHTENGNIINEGYKYNNIVEKLRKKLISCYSKMDCSSSIEEDFEYILGYLRIFAKELEYKDRYDKYFTYSNSSYYSVDNHIVNVFEEIFFKNIDLLSNSIFLSELNKIVNFYVCNILYKAFYKLIYEFLERIDVCNTVENIVLIVHNKLLLGKSDNKSRKYTVYMETYQSLLLYIYRSSDRLDKYFQFYKEIKNINYTSNEVAWYLYYKEQYKDASQYVKSNYLSDAKTVLAKFASDIKLKKYKTGINYILKEVNVLTFCDYLHYERYFNEELFSSLELTVYFAYRFSISDVEKFLKYLMINNKESEIDDIVSKLADRIVLQLSDSFIKKFPYLYLKIVVFAFCFGKNNSRNNINKYLEILLEMKYGRFYAPTCIEYAYWNRFSPYIDRSQLNKTVVKKTKSGQYSLEMSDEDLFKLYLHYDNFVDEDFIKLFSYIFDFDKNLLVLNAHVLRFTNVQIVDSPIRIVINKNGIIKQTRCMYCGEKNSICEHNMQIYFHLLILICKEKNVVINNFDDFVNAKKVFYNYYLNKYNEAQYDRLRAEDLAIIKPLLEKIKRYEAPLVNDKFSIDVSLVIDKEIGINISVGKNKKYIVSNIHMFLDAIENKEVVSYGKNLIFNHSIDNFDDEAKKIIKLLISVENDNDLSSKTFIITNQNIDEIIEYKRNTYLKVSFSDKKDRNPFVTNDKYLINVSLNEDMKLTIDSLQDGYILRGYKNDYFITDEEIKYIDYRNDDIKPLVYFCLDNPDFSFRNTIDVFSNEIYSRFNNIMSVPKVVKEKTLVKPLTIKIYFDNSLDGIIAVVKCFYDDLEVDINNEEVAKNLLFIKVNNFLDTLGFVNKNNKLIIKDLESNTLFLQADLSKLRAVSEVFISEAISRMKVAKMNKIGSRFSYKNGMLSVCLNDSPYSKEELESIYKAIKKKSRFVRLNKDTILAIDTKEANDLRSMIEEFNLDLKKIDKEQNINSFYALKLLDNELDIGQREIDQVVKDLLDDIVSYNTLEYNIPDKMVDVLRPYQVDAYKWLKTLTKHKFGGILADDMGLGKTLEIISLLEDEELNEPVLIICPKSLCYNWHNEFKKWQSKYDSIVIQGNTNNRLKMINNIDKDKVYIISYDTLKNDIDSFEQINFSFIILDEAQAIKNQDTLRAQSVIKLNSKYRFALTGTPIENTIMDLWSVFNFLMPGYLSTYSNFKAKFENAINIEDNKSVTNILLKKVSPFILRRLKKDVLTELPDKIETILTVDMVGEQKKIYDAQLLRVRQMLENNDGKIEILSSITRLRQICVEPSMFIENYYEESAKISLLKEVIDDYINDGHRIVIFSQFTKVFEKIEEILLTKKYKYFVLTGATEGKNRVKMAEEFNENEEIKVFIVSLKAGGTGLNLVGADVVIHLDPWWNIAIENQATDRTHRIGQNNIVNVIKIICSDSIEQKVIELQESKLKVVKKMLENNDEVISSLSTEDILYLLG